MARWQSGYAAACKAVYSGSIPLRASKIIMISKVNNKIEKNLVLVGGGHSHLNVLKSLTMNPIKNCRVTVVSNVYETPYSGMLPGYFENIYSYNDIMFDLYKICSIAGFRFIKSFVTGINGKKKILTFTNRPPLSFDYLSINIGISNNTKRIVNANKYALTLKPISKIKYHELTQELENKKIGIIGGGPAGVEVSLALKKRYVNIDILLFSGSNGILPNYEKSVKNKIIKILALAKIKIITDGPVKKITQNSIITSSNHFKKIDRILLSTEGVPPDWLKKTDLKISKDGFIETNKKLQTNFKNIFASGDIIKFSDKKLLKSGVYAVKSGNYLKKNIRNFILKRSLHNYVPQKNYLSIIGLSNGQALAYKYKFHLISKFSFKIKKLIDLNFMKKFKTYDKNNSNSNKSFFMDCKGCAAKVDISSLKKGLPKKITEKSEDANIIDRENKLVQSIDMINSIVTDPYLLGKISANHALSDIYASLSKPLTASMILQLPKSSEEIYAQDLDQIYSGARSVLESNSCKLTGGHTMIGEDKQPVVGFSIIGKKYPLTKKIINNNDKVFLTGKIGVGLIFAGVNSNVINSSYLDNVINQLEEGNKNIGKLFEVIKPIDATDITGFGLCNHLLNLKNRHSKINGITILKNKVSLFEGVYECLKRNINSTFYEQNLKNAAGKIFFKNKSLIDRALFDPQTVGGIAFIISKKDAKKVSTILEENKFFFNEIGYIDNSHSNLKVI